MAQRTSSVNAKWMVKISIDKKKKKPTVKRRSTPRKVTIRNTYLTTESTQQSQYCHQELCQIIAESKKQVDYEARQTMEMIEKWQRDTCSKFDIIQDYVIRMHNLQNSTTEETSESIDSYVDQQIEQEMVDRQTERQTDKQIEKTIRTPIVKPTKRRAEKMIEQPIQGVNEKIQQQSKQQKTVSFLSMPTLFEDFESSIKENASLAKPSPVLPIKSKKIERRRSTICVASRHPQSDTLDIPMRKKSCLVHSSVLAISKNPSKFNERSEGQVPSTIKDGEKSIGKKTCSTGNKRKSNASKDLGDDFVHKFMELRKRLLIDENHSWNAKNSNGDDESEMGYPKPAL